MAKSLKNLSIEDAETEISRVKELILPVRKEYKSVERKLTTLLSKQRALEEHVSGLKIETMKAGQIDWKHLLKVAPHSTVAYTFLSDHLRITYGVNQMGMWSGTQQSCISLRLKEDSAESLQKNIQCVRDLEAYVEPLDDGFKHFSIFESSCSEDGSYNLLIGEDGVAHVEVSRYYSTTKLFTGTIEEAVAYIQKNHYYE